MLASQVRKMMNGKGGGAGGTRTFWIEKRGDIERELNWMLERRSC